jgi:hypothetical protein
MIFLFVLTTLAAMAQTVTNTSAVMVTDTNGHAVNAGIVQDAYANYPSLQTNIASSFTSNAPTSALALYPWQMAGYNTGLVSIQHLNWACQNWWGYSGDDASCYAYTLTHQTLRGVKRVIFMGDSITTGTGASIAPQAPGSTDWPTQLCEGYSNWAVIPRINQGHGGKTLAYLSGLYTIDIQPWKPRAGEKVYLVIEAGTNDFVLSNSTGATVVTLMTTYITAAHADGFYVVLLNIPNSSGAGGAGSVYTSGENTNRQYFNTNIASCGADLVVNIDAAVSGNASYEATAPNGPPHFNDAGYAIFASTVNAALSTP